MKSQEELSTKGSYQTVSIGSKTLIFLGLQQLFNYLIFKIDQNIIFYTGNHFSESDYDTFLRQSAFLFKLPELISSILVSTAPVYLPHLKWNNNKGKIKKYFFFYLITSAPIYAIIIFIYSRYIWSLEQTINYIFLIPILLHSMLILPVNIITFNFLLNGKNLSKLLTSQFTAILVGTTITMFLYFFTKEVKSIFSIVPIQMTIYLIMGTFFLKNIHEE